MPLASTTFTRCMDKLASVSWQAAQAEVATIDVRKRVKSGAWCVELRYEYRVGDERFSSSRFQPGAAIAIRYDPSDPHKSVVYLDDVDVADFIFLILATVFLAAGVSLLKGLKMRAFSASPCR